LDLLKEEFPHLPIVEKPEEVVDREEEEDFVEEDFVEEDFVEEDFEEDVVVRTFVFALPAFHHMNDENDFAEEPLVDDDDNVAEELVVEEEDSDDNSSNST
jgi:hypothetical protein